MIITAFALALAAAPPAAPAQKADPSEAKPLVEFMSKVEPADCKARVEQALSNAGIDPQAWKPGENKLGMEREWKPANHPEAGYYRTVNKMVNGCMVPVPVGGPDVFNLPKEKRERVIINGPPVK